MGFLGMGNNIEEKIVTESEALHKTESEVQLAEIKQRRFRLQMYMAQLKRQGVDVDAAVSGYGKTPGSIQELNDLLGIQRGGYSNAR